MPKKWTVDELTRLAFVHAEDDRRSMAEAQGDNDYGRECIELADKMHAYRMKRWGRTQGEADIDGMTLVDVRDLPKENRRFGAKTSEPT
jgi:hypothetical protein